MDLEKARKQMVEQGYTCVLVRGGEVIASRDRGVKPLMLWLEQGVDLRGFSAADKVVGKATAFLYVHLGISCLYAGVISGGAAEVLTRFGIPFQAGQVVPVILNRRKDGLCPMESTVAGIDDMPEALRAIKEKFMQLNP